MLITIFIDAFFRLLTSFFILVVSLYCLIRCQKNYFLHFCFSFFTIWIIDDLFLKWEYFIKKLNFQNTDLLFENLM